MTRDPDLLHSHVELGISHLRAQEYGHAIVALKRARPLETGDQRSLMALAAAADMTGDFRLADRAYEKLLNSGAERAQLFNNIGYSYMLRGDLDKAVQYISEAARHAPENVTIINNLTMLRQVGLT